VEAVADGPAVARPLGAIHQGQGGHVARTSIPEAPWYIVEGNDKKRERLNCIEHLLSKIPYSDVPYDKIGLPERVFSPDYDRKTLQPELYVPKI
jgi:hypothetical protein